MVKGKKEMIGKNVTIKEHGSFLDCQGKIVLEKEKTVIIDLEKAHHFLLGSPVVWDNPDLPYGQIEVSKEKIIEEELRPEVVAKSLFDQFWTLNTLIKPFDPNSICMHEGCQEKVHRRIMVNCWGQVYEYDCCKEHADKYHGSMLDSFPYGEN